MDKVDQEFQPGKWYPIETAPMDGTEVDVWVRLRGGEGYRYCNASWKHHHWRGGVPIGFKSWGPGSIDGPEPDPSHWMPLTPPPHG